MNRPIFFWDIATGKSLLLERVERHADIICKEMSELGNLLKIYFTHEDDKIIDEHIERILRLETDADNIVTKIIESISSDNSPVHQKQDIVRLVFELEKIGEYGESIARLLKSVRDLKPDDELRELILNLTAKTEEAVQYIFTMITEHEDMKLAIKLAKNISKLESESDSIYINYLAYLSKKESISPKDLIIKDIISMLEEIADTAENAADMFRTCVCAYLA